MQQVEGMVTEQQNHHRVLSKVLFFSAAISADAPVPRQPSLPEAPRAKLASRARA